MNKRILILLVPMMTLVLSGCGKRAPRYPSDPSVPSTGTSGASGQSGTTGAPSSSGGSESSATSEEPGTDVLESITVGGDMSFKEYAVGDAFNAAGLTASGHYSVSGDKDITGNVEWAFTPATAAAETTSVNVTATASGVTSAAKTVTGITVAAKSKMRIAYEAAAALAEGASTTEKYEVQGIIVANAGNSLFVQDGGYGLYIYSSGAISGAAIKKSISLKATLKNYYGVLETTGTLEDVTVGAEGTLPTPLDVVSQNVLDTNSQNLLSNMSNAVLKTKGTWSSISNANCDFTVGTDDITVKFDKYSYNTADADSKTAFASAAVGETFNLTNLVTTVYSSSGNIKHQLEFVSSSKLVKVEKTVSSIAVKTAPTKTTYNKGETFDATGLVITATYSDSTTGDIAYAGNQDKFTFSPSGALTAGTTSVTITYGGQSATQAITVNDVSIVSIAISGSMTKTAYHVGDDWDPTGLVVTATYSDSPSHTEDVTSNVNWSYSPAKASSTDITSVTVTATHKVATDKTDSKSVTVTVDEAELKFSAVFGTEKSTATGEVTDGAKYKTDYNYTIDSNLTFSAISKVYPQDGKAIKFSSSSASGTMTVSIPEKIDTKSVYIVSVSVVAEGYSTSKDTVISVGGVEQTITKVDPTSANTYDFDVSSAKSTSVVIKNENASGTDRRFYIRSFVIEYAFDA